MKMEEVSMSGLDNGKLEVQSSWRTMPREGVSERASEFLSDAWFPATYRA